MPSVSHVNSIMSPQSTQGGPLMSPNQYGSNDPVHDLPPELLQAGWRKFWSKRENRPYFFNKITNESLWEMPRLGHVRHFLIFENSAMLQFYAHMFKSFHFIIIEYVKMLLQWINYFNL